MTKTEEVLNAVKDKLTPSRFRRQHVEATAKKIREAVARECEKAKLRAEVRLDGSVAKDTWIQDHVDVDVFISVSPELTKQQLEEQCLPIARRALRPHRIIERFADHPYLETYVPVPGGNVRVNVVPCYAVERGHWQSATDRTPYHTEYIRKHLRGEQKGDVRLLKAFLRGIVSYGADIKTGGFSGMLAETLILAYGEFLKVLEAFANWQKDDFIDVENYYETRGDEVHQIFPESLVVIDPVDKGRNLAAAVTSDQLWNFVAASRYFFQKPSRRFFEEPNIKPLTAREFLASLKDRNSTLICLVVGRVEIVVDVLWSQLYKTERALVHLLENNDFKVIRSSSWTDERTLNVLLFEIEADESPQTRLHGGPPVSRPAESAAFLAKHLTDKRTVSGPWIDGGRWVVQKRRMETSAIRLLTSSLKTGGSEVGVGNMLRQAVKRRMRASKDENIATLILRNPEFAKFMRAYLSGRPVWYA